MTPGAEPQSGALADRAASFEAASGTPTAMSDDVTGETGPTCGHPAAVGWPDNRPVEFDCPNGCLLTLQQVLTFADRRRSSG